MRAIDDVILNAFLQEPALAERQPREHDEELFLAAGDDAEAGLHVDEMGVVVREVEEQASGRVDEGDALMVSVLIIVGVIELVVHDSYEAADDETVFRERSGAVGGRAHCLH